MCTSPNFIIFNGLSQNFKPGKSKLYQFVPHYDYDKFLSDALRNNWNFMPIACGHCLECRRNHAQEWADRCSFEAKKYKNNYFITLSYDDRHLPFNKEQSTLKRDDFTLFMKRLRSYFPDVKLKVFYSGEYGDRSSRPHYHAIIFNLPLTDLSDTFKSAEESLYNSDGTLKKLVLKTYLRPFRRNESYYSETIHKAWQYAGNIDVSPFTYATACYVAQYVDKKVAGKTNDFYKKLGIEPEFIGMSKGLGLNGYNKNLFFSDIVYENYVNKDGEICHKKSLELQHKRLILPSSGKARIVSHVPRYYEKIFRKEFPDLYEKYVHQKTIINTEANKKQDRTEFKQKELDLRAHRNKLRFVLKRDAI